MNVQMLEGKSQAELIAMIARMQAQGQRKLTLKVAKSGAVSLYGMGRFPVTLYASQWDKVLNEAEAIREFIQTNANLLSQGKDDARFAKSAE